MTASDLPRYGDDLADFLWSLRSALGLTQTEAAQLCYLDHSRVARYENSTHRDKPRPGYWRCLRAGLALRQVGDAEDVKEALLIEVNKVQRSVYRRRIYADWTALEEAADAFLAQQRAKRRPKSSADLAAWNAMLATRLRPVASAKHFGLESVHRRLLDIIAGPSAGQIIVVEGLGGLGKTTLLDTVVRDPLLSRSFDGVVWVRAAQPSLRGGASARAATRDPGVAEPDETSRLNADLLCDRLLEQLDLRSALTLDSAQKVAGAAIAPRREASYRHCR